jgi:hypothetical protein
MFGNRYIICPNPNCGYKGKAKTQARGSRLMALILLACCVLPGILYLLFFQGYRYSCPKCGMQLASDN